MAQLLNGGFDATQFAPNQGGSGGLPVGRHPVIIASSEIKPNNAGTGGYLQLDLKVTEGEFAGATGVARLNLYAQSQKACEIAHGQMSALCHCVGVFNVPDSSVLHDIPFMVEVGPQALTEQQQEQKAQGVAVTPYTEVKKFLDRNGNEPGKAPANGNNGGGNAQQQGNNFNQGQQGNQQQQQNNGGNFGNQQQQPNNFNQQNNGGNQQQGNNFQQQDPNQQQQGNNGNFNQQPNNQQQNGNFNQQPQNNNFQQQQPQNNGGNFNQQQQQQAPANNGGGSNVPWGSK